jgi:hypothetical protein
MASTSSTSGHEPFSLLSSISDHVVHGEAVSSISASKSTQTEQSYSSNYGTVAWWKENYEGFGFTDEQFQVLEAVTFGVAPKEIRRYYKRKNLKQCGSA